MLPRERHLRDFQEWRGNVSEDPEIQRECEAVLELLMRPYGDRLTPEMREGLRGSVETVVKTVAAVRSVRLENSEAPLGGFAPLRGEG
jgi:hypothetical protein